MPNWSSASVRSPSHELEAWLHERQTPEARSTANIPDTALGTLTDFCTDVIRLPGDRPYRIDNRPWLPQILEDASRTIYHEKARQTGMSIEMFATVLYRAHKYPGTMHLYTSYSQDAAREIALEKFRPLLRDSGLAYKPEGDGRDRILSYYFPNGSIFRLTSAAGKFRLTRGPTVDFLYIDEAQSCEIDELPVAESTMLESEYGYTVVAGTGDWESTPWDRTYSTSKQYEWDARTNTWNAQNPESDIAGYHVSRRMMPNWTQAQEDAIRRKWSPARFDTEYLGIMTRGAKIPFPMSLIEPCMILQPMRTPSTQTHADLPLYAVIDWAGGGDSWTVLTISRGTHVQAAFRYDEPDVLQLAASVNDELDAWRPDHVISDVGGNAGALQRVEARRPVHKVAWGEHPETPISYKEAADRDIYAADKSTFLQQVQAWFSKREISIYKPEHEHWLSDHIMAETAATKTRGTGKSVLRFDKRDAGHPDDFLMTLGFLAAYLHVQTDPDNPANFRGRVAARTSPDLPTW